jgi:transposase-like protein
VKSPISIESLILEKGVRAIEALHEELLPMSDISAVSNLQSQWRNFADLDRARAIYAIHRAGTSLRALAKALNCSESLLRHLLTTLHAPAEDRSLAYKGKISTNELARRARAAGARRASKHREALELERAQEARKGCRMICDWITSEGISGSYGESIVSVPSSPLA